MNSKMRRLLDKTPKLKQALKLVARPIIKARIVGDTRRYQQWVGRHFASEQELEAQHRASKRLAFRPLISIIVPTYNSPKDFFDEMVGSVQAQTYDNWELVIIDDASPNAAIRDHIGLSARGDKRIRYKFLDKNQQIAGATNEGIKMAVGEYVALLDHDDVLRPDALYEIVRAINDNPALEFIYTDEDKIMADHHARYQPFFKPDWNPDFLRSINYITHFTAIKKETLDRYGYEDGRYNGTQDWELFLRITRNIAASNIHHIPKILYSWRVHEGSTAKDIGVKPYVTAAQRKALEDDVSARKQSNCTVLQDDLHPAQWRLEFKASAEPRISIVVGSANMADLVPANTTYSNYEIVVVGPSASYQDVFRKTKGEYLVFAEGELAARRPDWLEGLLGDASRNDVGFVLAECRRSDVLKNLNDLLSTEAVDFISRSTRRLAARHFYMTARYNVRTIHGGVVMVGRDKLRQSIVDRATAFELETASRLVVENGFRNLYNPYIKVLK